MITLTEQASRKVKEMLAAENNPKLFLRVGVRPGGCSGFTYGMGWDQEMKEGDHTFEQDGIKIVVDKDSYLYIEGTRIDYKESLMGGGFSIDNPNAVASCGCGASFRTALAEGKPEKCDE
ncbi:iron-sulfur cluster insertion protein ErpA [Brevibacillus thermoruber]|uniref:iron-sulfur cluster insertion protein ErpA n=1 Tax=Brevibacillus TaxID=55080 RepID=UPI0005D114D6|nr:MULTISPECIES: iron-sulfur cluster insertion protein ErpA [unclassified Brevibacillus]TRY24409.1 iron-sulfur cluster insertion protein ErpA [Brevibacillus sp. LEMMJ03]UYZ14331.1 iron-sulfur cluster insertion protein ErpA [Brevibacillus sp. WF146]